MSKSVSRSKRPIPNSNSLGASMPTSSSRPFLNMINPMNSNYHGYVQANQSIVEETGEDNGEDVDLEAGRSTIFHGSHEAKRLSTKSQGKHRVAWNPGASEMSILHPNIHKEDKIHERDSSDDEVPPSFLIEATSHPIAPSQSEEQPNHRRGQALYSTEGRKLPPTSPKIVSKSKSKSPVSTPPRSRTSDLNEESIPGEFNYSSSRQGSLSRHHKPMRGLDDYEKALWNWVNVYNLDAFLQEVYYYYEGKGIYSIALARGLNLLTVGFVIGFSTFLLGCIDYTSLRNHEHTRLSDIIVDRCVSGFSGFTLLFFLLFTAFYIWQIIAYAVGITRLVDMYNFYTHLLKIPDADIQTISWSEVVRRIGAIREENPLTAISSNKGRKADDTTTAKLDAHDIANRIMRQENYLIALFNKDLLDLRVPWPRAMNRFRTEAQGKGKVLTQALEWNLRFCLMEYLFDEHGKVRKVFLKSKNRVALIEGLKRRFIFMGILNAIFAPFIVLYVLMYSFFRYFEQYHKDPSSIGSRRYTSFASWKFREFNELPHIFTRRLDESYPLSNMYIGQFPNEKMTHIMRFVAFIAGSFAAVLVLATVIDPDLFLHFEITPHRTIVFYIGIFGAVLTVARGMVPEDNRVFDPELLMTEVIMYTHYMPEEWKVQLHSKKVHQEFGELFAMKVLIFAQELISVVLTPFVLWFSLPACAPAIIDFFREFSVHVDGRGYVCSFAEFNFERHGNVKFGAPAYAQDKKMVSNEGKMEKSFLNFKATNPDWNPTDQSGSLYLSRMIDLNAHHHARRRHHAAGLAGGSDMVGTVHFASNPPQESSVDMALRESRLAAAVGRRRGLGGSVIGLSGVLGGGTGPALAASVFPDLSTAPSAVLGDSQGSMKLSATSTGVSRTRKDHRRSSEEIVADDGVVSGLGESYVDGANRYVGKVAEEEEESLEDGGVLGLLAQIYGRRDGPAVVM